MLLCSAWIRTSGKECAEIKCSRLLLDMDFNIAGGPATAGRRVGSTKMGYPVQILLVFILSGFFRGKWIMVLRI